MVEPNCRFLRKFWNVHGRFCARDSPVLRECDNCIAEEAADGGC
jgi:hypothetical protein